MRIKHIDILRGIAAMLVAIFHLARSTDIFTPSFDYAKYGWVGVQIFFVISGFVLPYSFYKTGYTTKNFGIFFLKRIIRIYPAFISAIIIGIVLTLVTGRKLIPGIAIAAHLLFLNDIVKLPGSSAVFWTLAIEVQFYILIGLLYSYFLTSNIKSVCLILSLSAISIFFNYSSYIIAWFPFFALGILIYNLKYTYMPTGLFWATTSLLLIVICKNQGLPEAAAALFAMLFILYGSFEKNNYLNRLLLFLGTVSYSLYLIHWDLGRAAVSVSKHVPYISSDNFIRLIIGLIASVFFAWLLYITIEKPSVKLSAGIKYKKK